MKILLLGSNGQLGKELERQLCTQGNVVAFPRTALDITNYKEIKDAVDCVRPDVIVNAAAYTVVDKAESEKAYAFAVNADAVKSLARVTQSIGAWLIHYSTDYVFDGSKPTPYVETDVTNPINVYGASKLAGEQAISQNSCQHLIFRTTWVIGKYGNNFAKTILILASERNHLNVVSDQVGVPTSTSLICQVTLDAIDAIRTRRAWPQGIYHLTPRGESNWHEVAQTLAGFAEQQAISMAASVNNIRAITTADYPTVARRPLNSRLDTRKLQTQLSFDLPNWKDDFLAVASDIIKELETV